MNKYKILLLILSVSCANFSFADSVGSKKFIERSELLIQLKHPGFRLLKDKNFSKKLKKIDVISPMATIGDFNKDGKSDAVLYGVDRTRSTAFIYLVLSSNKKYKIFEVQKERFNVDLVKDNTKYLSTGYSKELSGLTRDTIQVDMISSEGVDNATTIYYYSLSKNKVMAFKGIQD